MTPRAGLIRSFIAVELDAAMRRALAETQASVRAALPISALRWVDPAGVHITLKFLGDASADQLEAIKQALAEVVPRHVGFRLTAARLGAFPTRSRASVLWVGLEGELMQLQRLRDDIERVVSPLGFPTESRRFHPHLTLARVRDASDADLRRVSDLLRHNTVGILGELPVAAVSLMRSDLAPTGARYSCLDSFELGQ